MKPWIDRQKLVNNAKKFVLSHGGFLRANSKRISSLVEIAVYNSIVQFYQLKGFEVQATNLGPRRSFRYKLTSSGLTENHSYFTCRKNDEIFQLLHNTKIQSAHDEHLYYTADVAIAENVGATTQKLKSGKRHSFVKNSDLVSFVEVKHLNPFPEALFNFSGLALEFMPALIEKNYYVYKLGHRICPMIVFTGAGSDHSERIKESLTERYKFNIVFGTSKTRGSVRELTSLYRYHATNPYLNRSKKRSKRTVVLKKNRTLK